MNMLNVCKILLVHDTQTFNKFLNQDLHKSINPYEIFIDVPLYYLF